MDESERRKEYLNRDCQKRFAAWKNTTTTSMWTALHWEKMEKVPVYSKSRRPSTAPPTQFGLKFTPKTEIPTKVDFLMDAVQELQSQMEQCNMNLSQQNVLIDNLTDIVERLQNTTDKQQSLKSSDQEERTEDVLEEQENSQQTQNTEEGSGLEQEQMEKVRSMIKEAMSSPMKSKPNKSRKAIPSYVVVDPAENKMKKKIKPTIPKRKRKSKTRKERLNRRNKIAKPVIPKVLKS